MAIEWTEAATGLGLMSVGATALGSSMGHLLADDAGREQLRRMAAGANDGTDYSRVDDHVVLVQVIATIRSGGLGAAAAPTESLKFRLVPKPASSSSAPGSAPARRTSAAAPPPTAEEPDIDVQAQVAVLQQAARDGTPFCEECEKARKQQAAMA